MWGGEDDDDGGIDIPFGDIELAEIPSSASSGVAAPVIPTSSSKWGEKKPVTQLNDSFPPSREEVSESSTSNNNNAKDDQGGGVFHAGITLVSTQPQELDNRITSHRFPPPLQLSNIQNNSSLLANGGGSNGEEGHNSSKDAPPPPPPPPPPPRQSSTSPEIREKWRRAFAQITDLHHMGKLPLLREGFITTPHGGNVAGSLISPSSSSHKKRKKKKKGKDVKTGQPSSVLSRWWILENEQRPTKAVVTVPIGVIHPTNSIKIYWDSLMIILLLYNCFVIPVRVAFDDDNAGWTGLVIADVVADMLFMVDIALTFFTAYYDSEGELVVDRGTIASRYLKTWCLPDLVASFPLDLFIHSVLRFARIIRFSRVFRFVRLLRIIRLSRLTRGRNSVMLLFRFLKVHPGIVEGFKLAFLFLWTAHFLACCLYFVGALYVDDDNVEESTSWLIKTKYEGMCGEDGVLCSVYDAPATTRYLVSLYFGVMMLSTVGFGDIVPWTTGEILIVIFNLTAGTAMFSYIISNMWSVVSQFDVQSRIYKERMDEVQRFSIEANIPEDLCNEIRSHVDYCFQHPIVNLNQGVMKDLPRELRLGIARHLYGDLIRRVHFLNRGERFIDALLFRLRPMQIGPGYSVYRRNDFGHEMYFILAGEIDLIDDQDTVHATFYAGNYFGENALIRNAERRTFGARAASWADLLCLSRSTLESLQEEFPEVTEIIQQDSQQRWKTMSRLIQRSKSRYMQLPHVSPQALSLVAGSKGATTTDGSVSPSRVSFATESQPSPQAQVLRDKPLNLLPNATSPATIHISPSSVQLRRKWTMSPSSSFVATVVAAVSSAGTPPGQNGNGNGNGNGIVAIPSASPPSASSLSSGRPKRVASNSNLSPVIEAVSTPIMKVVSKLVGSGSGGGVGTASGKLPEIVPEKHDDEDPSLSRDDLSRDDEDHMEGMMNENDHLARLAGLDSPRGSSSRPATTAAATTNSGVKGKSSWPSISLETNRPPPLSQLFPSPSSSASGLVSPASDNNNNNQNASSIPPLQSALSLNMAAATTPSVGAGLTPSTAGSGNHAWKHFKDSNNVVQSLSEAVSMKLQERRDNNNNNDNKKSPQNDIDDRFALSRFNSCSSDLPSVERGASASSLTPSVADFDAVVARLKKIEQKQDAFSLQSTKQVERLKNEINWLLKGMEARLIDSMKGNAL